MWLQDSYYKYEISAIVYELCETWLATGIPIGVLPLGTGNDVTTFLGVVIMMW